MGTRPPSPKSDTELETQKEATSQTALTGDDLEVLDDVKWEWGELPQSTSKTVSGAGGMVEKKGERRRDFPPRIVLYYWVMYMCSAAT